jgi:branched-chain amino acid transport system ATP-binding protein
MMRGNQMFERFLWLALTAGAAAAFAAAGKYYVFLLSLTAASAIAAIGLNILIGLSGQVSLGHAAFYAIGAYALGLLTTSLGLSFWLALPLAAIVSGLAGLLLAIPALRAAGPYLAMLTIAFGFIVEQGLAEWKDLTGGWNGLSDINMPVLFGSAMQEQSFGYLVLALLVLALFFFARLRSGAWGLAMGAVRDAPAAAQSLGFNAIRIRTVAFILSAMLTGVAGALFAVLNNFISPESFPFFQSIAFLLIVMIGGAGSIIGPVIGALAVVLLPEMLSSLAEYRVLVMGILFLLVLRVAPGGVAALLSSLLPFRRNMESGAQSSEKAALPAANHSHRW